MSDTSVHYRIVPADPRAHLFSVTCTIPEPDPSGQRVSLPAWIPGSYLVRDFAGQVMRVDGRSAGQPVAVDKIDKSTWQCAPCDGPLVLDYQVYASELSVRGAHIDSTHGYFNGARVFLRVDGQQEKSCAVEIAAPSEAQFAHWRVATSMRRAGAAAHGFGAYVADDYDDLIDHPVEMGEFDLVSFEARGVPHEIAVTGRHNGDLERLATDVARICSTHMDLFDTEPPIDRYLFLLTVVGNGYGGLEHRYSSSLIAARDDLPRHGDTTVSREYRRLLGLVSHEYFHLWNVKRIRPAAMAKSSLSTEAYTKLLWVFEGITSYYDDLALLRSGVIDEASYLDLLGGTATRVWEASGRRHQTLAEASFDAWIKFYKRDFNAANNQVSYYTKGALTALALDLTLRAGSDGRVALDDVVRALWQRHGVADQPVPEDGFERLVKEVSGVDLTGFFEHAVRSTDDLPLADLLAAVGVKFECLPLTDGQTRPAPTTAPDAPAMHVGTQNHSGNIVLTTVHAGGPAQRAGLASGDEIVAIDGLRVTAENYQTRMNRYTPGARVQVDAFRRDELHRFEVELGRAPAVGCRLTLDAQADKAISERRQAWLTGDAGREPAKKTA